MSPAKPSLLHFVFQKTIQTSRIYSNCKKPEREWVYDSDALSKSFTPSWLNFFISETVDICHKSHRSLPLKGTVNQCRQQKHFETDASKLKDLKGFLLIESSTILLWGANAQLYFYNAANRIIDSFSSAQPLFKRHWPMPRNFNHTIV